MYHPDNQASGSAETFQEIYHAYRILSDVSYRARYDKILQDLEWKEKLESLRKRIIVVPASRIIYAGSLQEYAKRGLLRVGFRRRDRRKYLNLNYDVRIELKAEELGKQILANIPLVVRVLCPECRGSDLYCDSCGGKGSYKSFRYFRVYFGAGKAQIGKLYRFELSRYRPDPFIHFKKKELKVLIAALPLK